MADPVVSESVRPPWRVMLASAAVIVLVVVVRNVVVSAAGVLAWALASVVTAVLLSPLVAGLARWIPRALAIIVVFVVVGAIGFGARSLYVTQLQDQVDYLADHAPNIAADIEAREDRIGDAARRIELGDRVGELTDRLQQNLGTPSEALVDAARAVPAYLVCFILTIFFMIYGPRIVSAALDRVPVGRRDTTAAALRGAARSTQVQVGGAVVGAVVIGLAAWLAGWLLGVPSVGLFALFAAALSVVPYVGVLVGSLPLLLVGIGVAPVWQVALAALAALVLQTLEATRWRPLVDGRSLYVGPALPIVGAVLGFALYGVGGVIVTVTVLIFALAVADEVATDDTDGDGDVDHDDVIPTPIDEYVEPDEPRRRRRTCRHRHVTRRGRRVVRDSSAMSERRGCCTVRSSPWSAIGSAMSERGGYCTVRSSRMGAEGGVARR